MKDMEENLLTLIDTDSDSALEFAKKHGNRTFIANDGNCEMEIEASSAKEAADEYVSGGDWGDNDKTFWVNVSVHSRWTIGSTSVDEDDQYSFDISVEPDEPSCSSDEHDWTSPYNIFGGLEENPGVFGNGGGVIIKEICSHCNVTKTIDTWAQNPTNGKQGLYSVEYGSIEESF